MHVVVGGGIAGLLAAALLSENGKRVKVYEASDSCGGLLRSFDGGAEGNFDQGTHLLGFTGIEVIDDILRTLATRDEWNYFEGRESDISGCFYNGKLQRNTAFPDIREVGDVEFRNGVHDLIFERDEDEEPRADAREEAKRIFGETFGERVSKIPENVFGVDSSRIDPFALRLLPLSRICVFGPGPGEDFLGAQNLNQRLAFYDQRLIPEHLVQKNISLYPKKRGISKIIHLLKNYLVQRGVEIEEGSFVESVGLSGNRISSVTVRGQEINVEHLVWCAGLPILAKLLSAGKFTFPRTAPPENKTVIAHFLVEPGGHQEDLYYFYVFDPGFSIYRVTNYESFCPQAGGGRHAITVEAFVGQDVSIEDAGESIAEELVRIGVVEDRAGATEVASYFLPGGFPIPTVERISGMDSIRVEIEEMGIENASMCGIMASKGLFFQADVIADMYRKVQSL